MELLFEEYVDECLSEVKYSLEMDNCSENGISFKEIEEGKLKEKIYELLEPKGTLPIQEFKQLRNQFLLKYYIFNKSLYPYAQFFSIINDFSSSEIRLPDFRDKLKWKKLLFAVIEYYKIHNDSDLLSFSIKEKNEGKAAKYWINKGYKLKITNGKINMESRDFERIGTQIERELIKIGGKNVIEFLLKNTFFDKEHLRYKLIKNKGKKMSSIPFGYLFNLSIKHFAKSSKLVGKELLKALSDLIEQARYYVSLLQIQTYNVYGGMFLNHKSAMDYIYDSVLYENIMLYRQFNPRYVTRIIKGVLEKYFKQINGKELLGLEFNEMLSIINYIINNPHQGQIMRTFNVNQISKEFPKLDKESIKRLLNLFTHKTGANKDFTHPNSISDFEKKPLLYSNGQYILIDRTLCSFSFYERLCEVFREQLGKQFDSELGFSIEDFIKLLLYKHGIKTSYGYYKQNEECDIVIETEEKIFFLEVKKKPLTKRALTGDGVTLFSDITKSILSSQIQLGKHEINLLKDGEITLYEKKGKVKSSSKINARISLNNRRVERISINANDYGILSDKMVIQNILHYLTGVSLKAVEKERDSELEEVRLYSHKLFEQYEELKKLKGDESEREFTFRELYFDCSFMSLQMLMTRLENVQGNEEFARNYSKTKFIITEIEEPYFEYFHLSNL